MKRQEGVTLIEVLLVLVISMGILYLSLQQYLSFRRDADITTVQYNVDLLFQSLAKYFRANCRTNPSFNSYFPGQSISVSMNTLVNGGYLTTPIALNPLVDPSGPGKGYVMQFNQYQTGGNLPTRTVTKSTLSGGTSVSVGKIVIWRAQVSVNISPTYQTSTAAPALKNSFSADCLSSLAGAIVTPCATAPTGSTTYIAWERVPSLSSSQSNSTFWQSMPMLKLFTQMYTTDPILILTDQTQSGSQYYVCGS